MVLSDSTIKELVEEKDIIIPFTIDNLGPCSYDITIDSVYLVPAGYGPYTLCKDEIPLGQIESDNALIPPHGFALAQTQEWVSLPDDVCAEVKSRSSVRRAGISICADAGWIDCGFNGYITLEIKNDTQYPIVIQKGTRVGQLIFYKMDYRCHNTYDGKYQNQDTTTGSIPDAE